MKKQTFNTNKLSLAAPCSVRWKTRKRELVFAGATLAVIFSLFSASFGQKENSKPVDASKKVIKTANQKNILSGTIIDNFGAVVPGVEIKLYKNKKQLLKTTSNTEGNYKFENLPAGIYTLEVKTASGFKKYKPINIKIKDGGESQFDITLKVDRKAVVVGIYIKEPLIEMTPNGA